MRKFLLVIAIALGANLSAAPLTETAAQSGEYRGPNLQAQRAAMARLAPLIGRWEGQADMRAPRQMTLYQSERVEPDLDGLILVIRGAGAPVFQAVAMVSFDERRSVYEFRSYAKCLTMKGPLGHQQFS